MPEPIQSDCAMKDCKITAEGAQLNFIGLNFNAADYAKIARIVREKAEIRVSIAPLQADMFE